MGVTVADHAADPLAEFRRRLQDLFIQVRRPTYRSLEAHADQDGRALRISTLSDLLNGSTTPRWDTVETYIRACARYAKARTIRVDPQLLDLDRWHSEYRSMENRLADQAAQQEQAAGRTAAPRRRRQLAAPAQLPASPPAFTGRTEHLAELNKLVSGEAAGRAATVVISAIDGTAGVGKTALALHWAHRVADQFPDGQLYVNLRGFDPSGQVMDPAAAVRGFLDALEVPRQRIPTDLDAQAALYRSVLAGRRMLIVLDNARDSAQVSPLLPGSSGCMVVVTSRNQLTSLIATHGATPLTLDLLTDNEAVDLLASRLGAERIAAEPEAVAEIVDRCARLPMALALIAAHAAVHEPVQLRVLAENLRDTQYRWHTLAGDEPGSDVRAVISWSYQGLSPDAAQLFRSLGLHPGPDITTAAAASLAALTIAQTERLLAELTRANLLTRYTPGRYTLHDLLRFYAAEQAEQTESDEQRHAASHRFLDHYLHTACAADRLLDPTRDPIVLTPPQPGANPQHHADHGRAFDWFSAEHPVLLAAMQHAAATGFDTHAWQLAWALRTFLLRQGHWHDQAAAGHLALAAARRLGDPVAQALAHRQIATADSRFGRFEDAHAQLTRALDIYTEIGDQVGQAQTHLSLGNVWDRRGQTRMALDHSRQCLRLFEAAGHRHGQASALNNLGWCHSQLGEYQQALTFCEQALALQQELGDRGGQAGAWDSLGYAHHRLGDLSQALACYEQTLRLVREVGDKYEEATALTRIGDTHDAVGNAGEARDAYKQALSILTELDHPDAEAVRATIAQLRS